MKIDFITRYEELSRRFSPDRIGVPVFGTYEELEEILKTVFGIYEDLKTVLTQD